MKYKYFLLILTLGSQFIFSQKMSGEDLLERAIAYHDPNGVWENFEGTFYVTMESPNRPTRKSKIKMDFQKTFFQLTVSIQDHTTVSTLDKGACSLLFDNQADFSEATEKEYRLTCDRAEMYRDYYTYLYGLPMKLKNSGTLIDPIVQEKKIDGIPHWVLRVTYDPQVGGDTWYFYFDQKTHALKQYQFFHDESKNDGEYIVLKEELLVNGIRMPQNRSWYYNSDDEFLGTDYLSLE
jgi:hypothetical protein